MERKGTGVVDKNSNKKEHKKSKGEGREWVRSANDDGKSRVREG